MLEFPTLNSLEGVMEMMEFLFIFAGLQPEVTFNLGESNPSSGR